MPDLILTLRPELLAALEERAGYTSSTPADVSVSVLEAALGLDPLERPSQWAIFASKEELEAVGIIYPRAYNFRHFCEDTRELWPRYEPERVGPGGSRRLVSFSALSSDRNLLLEKKRRGGFPSLAALLLALARARKEIQ